MSDIKNLLEKMDAMSAAERKPTGPKWPGYLKGTDSAKKSRSRMVGDGGAAESVEESENFLKELNTVINSNPVKRDLFQEWQEYKSISEETAPIPPDQRAQIRKDVKAVDYGKEPQPTTPPSPEQKAGIKQAVSAYNKEKEPKKQTVDEETVRVFGNTPKNVPAREWDYDDPEIRFFHRYENGSVEELSKGTPDYNDAWRSATRGREDPMTQKMIDLMQEPRQPSKEFKVPDPLSPQDYKVPGQDQGPYIPPDKRRSYMSDTPISEYGAPGSGIGNDTATNPAEVFAKGQERKAAKDQAKGQIAGLVGQLQGARAQLADLNKSFPQGANPVEKAMNLQQMSAQKIGIQRQIEDLAKQISQLRQQA